MKTYSKILSAIVLLPAMLLTGCHDSPEYVNDVYGNFDALADIIDTRYCFFEDKDLDWAEVTARYRSLITPETTNIELFFICSEMLNELKDGHVNLTSRYDVSYYRQWWSDYPQNFNMRTLEEYYLDFNWLTTSGIIYKVLDEQYAYMYYPSFSSTISESSLDYVLALMANSKGLIIDIRDNGGGNLTNINTLVGRFIKEKFTGGYIMHKTGPGHNDFSEPYPIVYEPAEAGRVKWSGDVIVLTNRSCFSAANSFVAVMKELPNVTIVGARTGGGGGLPFTSELPVGWSVRFSACPILDAHGNNIENGIMPDYEVESSDEDLAAGTDAILDFAKELLKDNEMPFPPVEPERAD